MGITVVLLSISLTILKFSCDDYSYSNSLLYVSKEALQIHKI